MDKSEALSVVMEALRIFHATELVRKQRIVRTLLVTFILALGCCFIVLNIMDFTITYICLSHGNRIEEGNPVFSFIVSKAGWPVAAGYKILFGVILILFLWWKQKRFGLPTIKFIFILLSVFVLIYFFIVFHNLTMMITGSHLW